MTKPNLFTRAFCLDTPNSQIALLKSFITLLMARNVYVVGQDNSHSGWFWNFVCNSLKILFRTSVLIYQSQIWKHELTSQLPWVEAFIFCKYWSRLKHPWVNFLLRFLVITLLTKVFSSWLYWISTAIILLTCHDLLFVWVQTGWRCPDHWFFFLLLRPHSLHIH